MPVVGGGMFSARMGGLTAVIASLVAHLVYGALLGGIAGALERFPSSPSPRTT
jgi:predicted lipid-binding transport protein (Tim44 family)